MDLSSPWLQFLAQVLVGTIAGGVTNAIAVWMLFHPYERRFGLQGAIPKNKARLARAIGRTVGERLLTPSDMLEELRRSRLRELLDSKVAEIISGLLETERGPLRAILPATVLPEVERGIDAAAPAIADRFAAYLETPEFTATVQRFVARSRAELERQPLGDILTSERRERLSARAREWAADVTASEGFEQAVRDYLERNARALLASDRPLVERVPAPVTKALERAIESYLPLAVDRVGEFLKQPAARERIRDALHGLFSRFVDDLRFHERVIAKLVVTERTFEKVLNAIERDGVEQLASLLDDPLVRDEITRTAHDAILSYVNKPLNQIVGRLEAPHAQDLIRTIGDYTLQAMRAEATRDYLINKLDDVLARSEDRTLGDMLRALSDATIADWIVSGARAQRTRELTEEAVRAALGGLLDRPIGRPARWLPADTATRLGHVAAPALWDWMEARVPEVLEHMHVDQMVERKVMGFSTARVEEIIRGVTQRELNFIVFLGWVLGAIIGALSFGMSRFLN